MELLGEIALHAIALDLVAERIRYDEHGDRDQNVLAEPFGEAVLHGCPLHLANDRHHATDHIHFPIICSIFGPIRIERYDAHTTVLFWS